MQGLLAKRERGHHVAHEEEERRQDLRERRGVALAVVHAEELQARSDTARTHTNYPLTVVVYPGDDLGLHLSYDERYFDEETVDRLLTDFKRLLGYGEPSSEAIRAGKRNIVYHLDYIAHLLGSRNWLAGEYLTLADISAAAHLSCLDYLCDVSWDEHPSVKEWYALIKCRPAFRGLLDDRVQGFKPPAHFFVRWRLFWMVFCKFSKR